MRNTLRSARRRVKSIRNLEVAVKLVRDVFTEVTGLLEPAGITNRIAGEGIESSPVRA